MFYWKKKVILAKDEVTYGLDPVPTGLANAIQATNITLQPMEGEDVSRNLERPYFGAQPKLPVGLHCVLTFDVEMVGSGTLGVAPAWGVLHRGCSVAEVVTADASVEYTPISADQESLTLYLNIDGLLHSLLGARGTFVGTLNAQGIPVWRYTFTGLFTLPTASALPTPDYSKFMAPQVATSANTPTFQIGGTDFILRSFEFDRGAQVEKRFLVGKEQILITDALESVKVQVEAVALATYDPFSIPQAQTTKTIQLIHGTTAGSVIEFNYPRAIQERLSGYANEQNVLEWPLTFAPQPDEGDDQWSIKLAA